MRSLALLTLLVLTACAQAPAPAESAIGGAGPGDWPRVGPESLAKWASFPVNTTPRPLVLLGERVAIKDGFQGDNGKVAFMDGRIDANGKVPPGAAEAFAQLTKPGAGEPKIRVLSATHGKAVFGTDRGPTELSAWIFELTETRGPVSVLEVKPDYAARYATTTAKISADGMTLTVPMLRAPEPCPGDPRLTYEPEWLESPTAVAVGLKQPTGKLGDCARDMFFGHQDYTIKLAEPLGNRVLADSAGNPIPVLNS